MKTYIRHVEQANEGVNVRKKTSNDACNSTSNGNNPARYKTRRKSIPMHFRRHNMEKIYA